MTDNTLRLAYGIRGELRKSLVKAVAEYRETFSEYLGAPTFDYIVEDITIDRDGNLIFSAEPDPDDLKGLVAYLAGRGFPAPEGVGNEGIEDVVTAEEASSVEEAIEQTTTDKAEKTVAAEKPAETVESVTDTPEPAKLTIELPREGFSETALENLQKLVDSKATLLKKSLGTEDLTIEITEERIRFPWFSKPTDKLETEAYTHLITALGEMAKNAKRVTAKDRPVESEKYAFRTWLLRLGFVGSEFKHERALLMKNLSGHAAFKTQADADAFAEKQRAKKAAETAEKEGGDDLVADAHDNPADSVEEG